MRLHVLQILDGLPNFKFQLIVGIIEMRSERIEPFGRNFLLAILADTVVRRQVSWDKLVVLNKGRFLVHRIKTENWNETNI